MELIRVISSILFDFALVALVACTLRRLAAIQKDLNKLTVAGEDLFNDNELNTVFIQKALDFISEQGYEPEIDVDENGQRWILAKVNGKNFRLIKLTKELFGGTSFKPLEKELETTRSTIQALERMTKEENTKENA
jgi:hypothetical protein